MFPRTLMGILDCGHYIYLPFLFSIDYRNVFQKCSICKKKTQTVFYDLDILNLSIFNILKNKLPSIISNCIEILINNNIYSGIIFIDDYSDTWILLKNLLKKYNFLFLSTLEILKSTLEIFSCDNIIFLNIKYTTVAQIFDDMIFLQKYNKIFLLDENEILKNGEILNMNNIFFQKYV